MSKTAKFGEKTQGILEVNSSLFYSQKKKTLIVAG
jgi:hypothetical protein